MKPINLLTAALTLSVLCIGLSAQDGPIYERGATYLENIVPPSPDPASIVKYADVPFTHSSGLAEYSIPFYVMKGSELTIPIGLHYASGGIKLDEIAGVAGLGWNLQAGGCITRTVMDMPDEYSLPTGPFRHEMPSGQLLSDLEGMVNNDTSLTFLRDLVWNRIDVGLDRYNYSVCGLSGSFVIKDSGEVFQLSGDGVIIDYTLSDDHYVDEFSITGPDGTVYVLSIKEMATRDGRGLNSIDPMNGTLDQWTAPTTWHLTSVHSRSGLETAQFTYSEPCTWDRSVRSNNQTLSITCGTLYNTPSRNFSSYDIESSYETCVLTGITLNSTVVSFEYSQGTGSALRTSDSPVMRNFPFRLTEISVVVGNPEEEIKRLEVNTGRASYDGRVILNSLKSYSSGVLDNQWMFTYKTIDRTISAGSQDWYGYYNGENEFSDNGNNSICPFEIDFLGEGSFLLTNGFPDADYASYMSLISVNNDGAVTNFAYEGNNISTTSLTSSIGVRVKSITLPGGLLNPTRVRYFTYEEPYSTGPVEPSDNMYCTVDMSFTMPVETSYCNWKFTLHDTPVTLGPSIRDSRVYYGKVTEDVSDQRLLQINNTLPTGKTSRTVYEYSIDDVCPSVEYYSNRFPSFCNEFYQSNSAHPLCSERMGIQEYYNNSGPVISPVLLRREDYAYRDGTHILVSSVDYEYDNLMVRSVLVDYYAVQAYHHWVEGYMEYDHIFHFPIYAAGNYGKHPVNEIRVRYYPSGNDTTVVNTSYVSRTTLEEPIRISSISMAKGRACRQIDYRYADNMTDGGAWTMELRNQHCLSIPVWRSISYGDSSSLLPSSNTYKEEIKRFGWFEINGQQCLMPSSRVEYNLGVESWREDILSRDNRGNISSVKEKGQPETVVLWSYSGCLPVAVIRNASFIEVQNAIGGADVLTGLTSSDTLSQTHLDKLSRLRTSLPQSHITIFTHRPGIGVTSITDPAGLVSTIEYNGGRLVCIRDNDGNKIEEYEYNLMSDEEGRRHIHSRIFRDEGGMSFSEDISWWDVFGRKTQDIALGGAGNGDDLVTAYDSDFFFHDDVKTWLPFPVNDTNGDYQINASDSAAIYHSSTLAYSFKNYELSSRDILLSESLPGYFGTHELSYVTDVSNDIINYRWINDTIAVLSQYSIGEIIVTKTIDADGRTISTYKDFSDKILAKRYDTDAPTYYIYDVYERLRAVKSSGIAITDTLNMWRYEYDSLGRLSSKGIPGSVREYYSYDEEDRLVSVLRDGVLKEMEYDSFGRVCRIWQTYPEGQRTLLEEHTYDIYSSGVTGSNPKGKKTQSRIAVIASDSSIAGYTKVTWSYDSKGRPVILRTRYNDGSEQIEELEYTFSGDVESAVIIYLHGNNCDELTINYTYDTRGRLKKETSTLTVSDAASKSAEVTYGYDMLGRNANKLFFVPGGKTLYAASTYALQGWQTGLTVTLDGTPLFSQTMGYDQEEDISSYQPQYTGLISIKDETWGMPSGPTVSSRNWYTYDHAARLSCEYSSSARTIYRYDVRGNLLEVRNYNPSSMLTYSVQNDRLIALTYSSPSVQRRSEFSYDDLGRMTYDGQTGQSITYNTLDLVEKISVSSTTLVNYRYLADGTKLSALDGSGEGFVYRGPFVYRTCDNGSSLTLESAVFGGGRLTPGGAMLYVTDYLGSVRAVVNGITGTLYKVADFSAFGEESDVASFQSAPTPVGITFRDSYTGHEDQSSDFGTSYTDFGARQYNPALRRWMTPDPLSEKYYGLSPYAFCNNNPVNLVDEDGEVVETLWDLASICAGIQSLVQNIESGNVKAAVGDGLGIVVDAVAAAVPFVPGGVGAVRTGRKLLDLTEAGVDALKLRDELSSFEHAAEFGIDSYKNLRKSMVSTYGTGSGLEVHHLVEKRFAEIMEFKKSEIPAIVLTKDEHRRFTNAWRSQIGYGSYVFFDKDISSVREQILNSARTVYKDHPDLLKTIEACFK